MRPNINKETVTLKINKHELFVWCGLQYRYYYEKIQLNCMPSPRTFEINGNQEV
jgi:hypothetical protein